MTESGEGSGSDESYVPVAQTAIRIDTPYRIVPMLLRRVQHRRLAGTSREHSSRPSGWPESSRHPKKILATSGGFCSIEGNARLMYIPLAQPGGRQIITGGQR